MMSGRHCHRYAAQLCSLFFFNDTATTEIYTLSLHDALPIFPVPASRFPPGREPSARRAQPARGLHHVLQRRQRLVPAPGLRSEEHTSELQSPCNLVCRLLLEKKKKLDLARCASAQQSPPRRV